MSAGGQVAVSEVVAKLREASALTRRSMRWSALSALVITALTAMSWWWAGRTTTTVVYTVLTATMWLLLLLPLLALRRMQSKLRELEKVA